MFGNKSLMTRVLRAVQPCLEPGEQLVVPVYLHSYRGSDLGAVLIGLPGAGISTWIAALTDRRVLVFEGNGSTRRAAACSAPPRGPTSR